MYIPTELRQELFDYFLQEHSIMLLDSDYIEIEEILDAILSERDKENE